jgi:glycosyltransferase involved in cell wall biosynthesis
MRIVHVVRSDGFAGVERYICVVANELAARGHEVHAVGGEPTRMRQELGSTVGHSPAASSLEVVSALARLGKRDVVHAHMTAAEVACACAEHWNGAPIVSTRHFPDRRLARFPAALGRLVGRRLAVQIAISEFVAAAIGEPAVVIHNGVPQRPQAAVAHPTVLLLQRLQPEKAPLEAIEIWATSRLGEAGWRLLVAGAGTLDRAARELVRSLGIAESVRFLGHVAETDALLAGAAVLLAPASAEPFGLSVVEAMAHGVPVVAAAGGAHLETLGDHGLLYAPGNTDEAAALLNRLAEDRELRLRVGGELRARQRSLFGLEAHVARLEDLYKWTCGTAAG